MPHELLVLRHAKSSWGSINLPDFDRPLAPRGESDATFLGEYMSENGIYPNLTITSAAQRARETTELVLAINPEARIEVRDSLYHAGLATLVNTVREQDDGLERLMLVGHNPGMDQLLAYLCEDEISLTDNGKLMTTAALARIKCDCSWAEVDPEKCVLAQLLRPKNYRGK